MQPGNKPLLKKIAEERIGILFDLSEKSGDERLARKYVATLRKISSHYKVKIPKKLRDRICTHCNVVLVPGRNATVRIASSKGYVVYKCNSCGRENHIYFRK